MKKQIEKILKKEEERPNRLKRVFGKLSKIGIIVAVVFVIVILVFSFFGGEKGKTRKARSAWQAVFLTNGQVYFGHVEKINKREIVLKNIYYLRMTGILQQGEKPTEFSLVKLGEELHGPVDEMYINRDHVLFLEYLKNDSKVVQAIRKSMSQEK